MGIKRKIKKITSELASRPTRSQRKGGTLASEAEAAALAAKGRRLPRRPRGKGYGAADAAQAAAAGGRPRWSRGKTPGAAMSKSYPQGLAATLRRKPTAGSRSRPSLADTRSRLTPGTLSQLTRGRSSRKRSR